MTAPTSDIQLMDNIEYMRGLPDESMQLIVTSPPYNIGKEYEKKSPLDVYLEGQEEVIKEALRLLKPNGSICWQVGAWIDKSGDRSLVVPLDILFYPIFMKHGLRLRNRIAWTFGSGLHCKNRFSGRYETVLWFTKSDDYVFNLDDVRVPQAYPGKKYCKGPKKGQLSCNPLGKNPSNVWDISNIKAGHGEKTGHPCQFPEALVERLVLALSNKGDNVLDPYMGSGTTASVAVKNGRNAFGCDITPEYVDISRRRVANVGIQPIYAPSAGQAETKSIQSLF